MKKLDYKMLNQSEKELVLVLRRRVDGPEGTVPLVPDLSGPRSQRGQTKGT